MSLGSIQSAVRFVGGVAPAVALVLSSCAHDRSVTPSPAQPPVPSVTAAPTSPPPPALQTDLGPPSNAARDEWQSSCARDSTCGACLNHGPCQWCAAEDRCVGPGTACSGARVAQPGQCTTAPLEVAKARYPALASQLNRYESEIGVKDANLTGEVQESFFLNTGDCFAVLAEPLPGNPSEVRLGYALRIRGVVRPGDRVALPEPSTGGRDGRAELSPEFCPWEHQPLVIWNASPKSAKGSVRLRLLRRPHPDPARLARERPKPAIPQPSIRGGSCSSMECGEDCRSELRACNLDCFRYGSHDPTQAQICKNTCNQMGRACERGCAVPCP